MRLLLGSSLGELNIGFDYTFVLLQSITWCLVSEGTKLTRLISPTYLRFATLEDGVLRRF